MKRFFFSAAVLLLAGCSGGSSSTPTPSATASATRQTYLEKAESQFLAGKFSDAGASALLAVAVAEESKDQPALLRAKTLLLCSQARGGHASPGEIRQLLNSGGLDEPSRKLLQAELAQARKQALRWLESARTKFRQKQLNGAAEDARRGLAALHAVGDNSQDGALHLLLGRCLLPSDRRQAKEAFEQALRARPPALEAKALLAPLQAEERRRALAPKPLPPADADGNRLISDYGGLQFLLTPRRQILIRMQNASIQCSPGDWPAVKNGFANEVAALEQIRAKGGGGSSRVVLVADIIELAFCSGTWLQVGGWQVRSSQPTLELWLIRRDTDSITPWRCRLEPNSFERVLQEVDAVLKQLPRQP